MMRRPRWLGGMAAKSKPTPSSITVRPPPIGRQAQVHAHLCGTRVLGHVVERLLGNAVQRHLHLGGKAQSPSTLSWMGRRARPMIASLSWRSRSAGPCRSRRTGAARAAGCASRPGRRALARAARSTACGPLRDDLHNCGSTSAIRLAENSVWVTASCRSRARRVRSAITASLAAFWARAPRPSGAAGWHPATAG